MSLATASIVAAAAASKSKLEDSLSLQALPESSTKKPQTKSALELAFQQEVAPKLKAAVVAVVVSTNKHSAAATAVEFNSQVFVRDNLKYIEDSINENSDEINFPNKSSLIINTILQCLEDEKQMVKRNILDFMH